MSLGQWRDSHDTVEERAEFSGGRVPIVLTVREDDSEEGTEFRWSVAAGDLGQASGTVEVRMSSSGDARTVAWFEARRRAGKMAELFAELARSGGDGAERAAPVSAPASPCETCGVSVGDPRDGQDERCPDCDGLGEKRG